MITEEIYMSSKKKTVPTGIESRKPYFFKEKSIFRG
jgi:hypothetical protein